MLVQNYVLKIQVMDTVMTKPINACTSSMRRSSDLQHPQKSKAWWLMSVILILRAGREKSAFRACWISSLANQQTSCSVKDPIFKS